MKNELLLRSFQWNSHLEYINEINNFYQSYEIQYGKVRVDLLKDIALKSTHDFKKLTLIFNGKSDNQIIIFIELYEKELDFYKAFDTFFCQDYKGLDEYDAINLIKQKYC